MDDEIPEFKRQVRETFPQYSQKSIIYIASDKKNIMTYKLDKVTIRLKNDAEGMNKIGELFADIVSGEIPLIFNSDKELIDGIAPVSEYSNYESDETGEYDLSVIAVEKEFFKNLENEVSQGKFIKYDISGEDVMACAQSAWKQVWQDQSNQKINRSFNIDYESTVPKEFTSDGKAHCILYIGVDP